MSNSEDREEQFEILEGMTNRKMRKRKKERALATGQILLGSKPEPFKQKQESIEGTREHLLELRRELAAEKAGKAAVSEKGGWTRKKKMMVAAPIAAVVAFIVALTLSMVIGRGPEIEPVGVARVDTGTMQVLDVDGERVKEEDGVEMYEDYTLNTESDSRAVLTLNDESAVRLDSLSSIKVGEVSDEDVRLSYRKGRSYYRLEAGTDYRVGFDDIDIVANGAAFNISQEEGQYEVIAVDESFTVKDEASELTVNEGNEVVLKKPVDVAALKTAGVRPEEITSAWFEWNKKQDEEGGFDTGILENIEVVPEDGQVTPPPGDETQIQPAPSTEGTEQEPQPQPQEPSMNLGSRAENTQATLSWNLQNAQAYDRVAVLRSETNPSPVYPGDLYGEVGPEATSYTDAGVRGGKTYYYRVATISGAAATLYSNVVEIDMPLWGEASLGASLNGSSVRLDWSSQANFDVSGYAVCRSQDGSEPTWPPPSGQWAALTEYTGPTGTYLDETVQRGRTYTYRVGLLSGSGAVIYSNSVTLRVPPPGSVEGEDPDNSPDSSPVCGQPPVERTPPPEVVQPEEGGPGELEPPS